MNARERELAASERIAATLEGLLAIQTRRERLARERREDARVGSQSTPRRIGMDLALRGVPGLAGEFRRVVPPEFWTLDAGAAVISCPCGIEDTPAVEQGGVVTCECERAYTYTGDTVRVAFSPANRPTPVQS